MKLYTRDIFVKTLVILLGSFVLTALLFFVFLDGIFNETLANYLSSIDYGLYHFLVGNKELLMIVFYLLIMFVVFYFVLAKTVKQFSKIVDSVDSIFDEKEGLIQLPNEFPEIEAKLNQIKYDYEKNQQIAKEAEMRKNDLIMYMAHDLKTPLTSVIGYLVLLNDEEKLPDKLRKKYAKITLDKAYRLETLINEFFEMTRYNFSQTSLVRHEVDVTVLFQQLIDEFYPMLTEHQLTCQLKIPEHLNFPLDDVKMIRVFDNLLRNAIFYSRAETEIFIQVDLVNDVLEIEFHNQGSVIPKQKLEHIFDKFYRLDQARATNTGGAGLGLAIAKEIVELHGGSIVATSTEEDTMFRIRISRD